MSAVIFDLDGTLIDASRDIHACASAALASEGYTPLSVETVKSFVGNGAGVLISRCIAAVGAEETEALHRRMYDVFQAHYVQAVTQTEIYPGVVETLEALKADGYRLGLCTNKPEAATFAVLDHLDLTRFFDGLAFGDGPYPRKPDPAALRHVIDQIPARRFLYVGDSIVDARTAQAAKLPFALYTEGFRNEPLDDLPHDAAFDDWADLPAIAARLAPRPE